MMLRQLIKITDVYHLTEADIALITTASSLHDIGKIYIPEEKLAIETVAGTEEIELVKEHLCQQRNIRRMIVPYKENSDEAEYAGKIKKAFQGGTFLTIS